MKYLNELSILSLGLVLSSAVAPNAAFAWGSKKTAADIPNKAEFLESAIRDYNAKYADIKFGPNYNGDACYYSTDDKRHQNNLDEQFANAQKDICSRIAPLLENGMTCTDFVSTGRTDIKWTDEQNDSIFGFSCTSEGHVQFYAQLTPKAKQLLQSSFFYDSGNADVDYNVRAIQSALNNLQLLPRQRKALDGFFNATNTFAASIDAEKAKAAKGEKSLPLTHRSFASQASLLVAYYRYLKDDFAELAQFGSAAGGVSQVNKQAVDVINTSIQHLTDDYGLDTDVSAKQVADYGRVLLDLMNTFSLSLTVNEKATVQPIVVQLVTQVIPTSEAYGDVGAHDAVVKLKDLWESESFKNFLTDKLSVSDDKSTSLILNMSAAAYKIGLSANVDIKTFDSRDADRIKNQKR
jgi:hypothetical protein